MDLESTRIDPGEVSVDELALEWPKSLGNSWSYVHLDDWELGSGPIACVMPLAAKDIIMEAAIGLGCSCGYISKEIAF